MMQVSQRNSENEAIEYSRDQEQKKTTSGNND